jgi:hypothetical protein
VNRAFASELRARTKPTRTSRQHAFRGDRVLSKTLAARARFQDLVTAGLEGELAAKRCYACDAPAIGTRDRRPEGGELEQACVRHTDAGVIQPPVKP